MTIVERVARAIAKNSGHVSDKHWPHYVQAARAAIDAMREPTDEMLDAGEEAGMYDVARTTWSAMIDAALNTSECPT